MAERRPRARLVTVLEVAHAFRRAGEPIAGCGFELRLFIDKYFVEVFANGRQSLVAEHLEHTNQRALDAFTVGVPTTLKKVEIWKLRPTNEGFREAQKNRIWQPDEGK